MDKPQPPEEGEEKATQKSEEKKKKSSLPAEEKAFMHGFGSMATKSFESLYKQDPQPLEKLIEMARENMERYYADADERERASLLHMLGHVLCQSKEQDLVREGVELERKVLDLVDGSFEDEREAKECFFGVWPAQCAINLFRNNKPIDLEEFQAFWSDMLRYEEMVSDDSWKSMIEAFPEKKDMGLLALLTHYKMEEEVLPKIIDCLKNLICKEPQDEEYAHAVEVRNFVIERIVNAKMTMKAVCNKLDMKLSFFSEAHYCQTLVSCSQLNEKLGDFKMALSDVEGACEADCVSWDAMLGKVLLLVKLKQFEKAFNTAEHFFGVLRLTGSKRQAAEMWDRFNNALPSMEVGVYLI
jgi:hypothetical protein